MPLRDWIHPGWFAAYDWWQARRDAAWLDDELRRAKRTALPAAVEGFGLAQLHRGPVWPMSMPTAIVERARKRRDEAMRKGDDEAAFLAAADQMRDEKIEKLAYNGPLRTSPMPLSVGDRWPGSELAVVTRIERGSWMDHAHPGDTEMVRVWTRAASSA